MQCSVAFERDRSCGNKMKTNSYKNPYRKETNLDNIVDELCTRLQDIKDQEGEAGVGMPTCALEHSEAVRRYYAAFPALTKGQESPLQYYLPPPAWCRKPAQDNKVKMQNDLPVLKDWNSNNRNKKFSSGKERRKSYDGQKKSRKRCNSYGKYEKESLPEWVTHEGVWDMETQDPVKEFIRAIALDEGYGTCENTVTDEIKEITQVKIRMNENMVPDWEDSINFDRDWVYNEDLQPKVRSPMEEELYAKFEAKFDRSIEALWSKDQNTPDDEYQDLPIDFQDLLSSPSDHLFADPSAEKCSLISLTESIWSNDGFLPIDRGAESPSKIVEVLHDRFKPLNLTDVSEPTPAPREIESFSLYEGDEIYDAMSTVASTMRSFTAINHSRDASGFVEVPPRRRAPRPAPPAAPPAPRPAPDKEDLLTSSLTHFRPIRRDAGAEPVRYIDGDSFDIRGDLDPVEFHRSESGGVYLESSCERYLEYRTDGIDYGRLKLTAAQRCPDLDDLRFKLRFPVRQTDAGVQTERPDDAWAASAGPHKKMRPSDIWGAPVPAPAPAPPAAPLAPDDLQREWDELLADISAVHAAPSPPPPAPPGPDALVTAALQSAERKRRHSAARGPPPPAARPPPPACPHPHARFLHCLAPADRPLTR